MKVASALEGLTLMVLEASVLNRSQCSRLVIGPSLRPIIDY